MVRAPRVNNWKNHFTGGIEMLIDKGEYVRIRKYLLRPEDRLGGIPEETKKQPLKMWVKGRLNHESELFQPASITTATGRTLFGDVKETKPTHKFSYGAYVDEILQMREIILREMWGNDDE